MDYTKEKILEKNNTKEDLLVENNYMEGKFGNMTSDKRRAP